MMYGLVNRSIQCFVEDTYGRPVWDRIVADADLDSAEFEAMLHYEDEVTEAVLSAAKTHLSRDRNAFLEDLGCYLVTHENMNAVRRLLRFGGHTFEDFLHSLDDLHDRVKLAIPDLELPRLSLEEHAPGNLSIYSQFHRPGFGAVLQGVVRAVADDYGALALLELESGVYDGTDCEVLHVNLLESAFATGRSFSLGGPPVSQ